MKILIQKKLNKEDINYHEKENPSLPRRVTEEEAQANKLGIYVNEEWQYVMGKETIEFVFLSVYAYIVYGEKEDQICNRLYQVELWTGGELFQIEITQREYYDEKWLKDLRTKTLLLISKRNYQKLVKSIKPIEAESFYFDTVGIHRLHNEYYYVTSNCAITSNGVIKSIKALQEGFDLECGGEVVDREVDKIKSIKAFMKYSQWNYEIFYSIHCISIIAILRYFLKELGISAGAVLWIDGSVSSGKTSLAITMGDFFNRSNDWRKQMSHLHSTKAKTKVIAKELVKYRNAVFILDDIKKEETVRNRENAKNITDLLVRSIYMGKIGEEGIEEKSIDATAIITGEFYNEKESTTSRVLYLNIDNFLEKDKNKKQLDVIQQDKYYFAKFMVYFLQWLMKKSESNERQEYLKIKFGELQEELSEHFQGKLNRRMIETVANYQLVSEILNLYFQENEISQKEREKFYIESKNAILSLGKATLYRCLDYTPIIQESFVEILPKLQIKDCRYGENYLNAVCEWPSNYKYLYDNGVTQKYDGEEGVSDNGQVIRWRKIWLLGLGTEHDGIMYNIDGKDVLLVKAEILCELIRERVKVNMKKWNTKCYDSDLINERILIVLLNNQCIYGYRRKEGSFNKIINVPEFSLQEEEIGKRIIESEKYKMVKINIDSKVKYKGINTLKKISLSELFPILESIFENQKAWGPREYRDYENELRDLFAEINRFSDLK